jgi:PAS domain S-box-containing protein
MEYTEQQRLIAVERFKQPDDGIARDLNDLVGLIAEICGTPVALVTLLDDEIQWFKAAVGTEVACTPKGASFCNSTIKQTGLYIIPDTINDDLHKNNPLVTGAPYVRFYAGAPLITKDGHAIGSLCIIDMEPRELTMHQQKSVLVMAKQVINLMELNWSFSTLAEQHTKEQLHAAAITASELKLKAIFDSSNDSHILAGKNLEVLAYNRSAATFIQRAYHRQIVNGDSILCYTEPAMINQFKKYFAIALTGRSIKREWLVMPGTPNACWQITSFTPVRNETGEVIGVALNSIDITNHKKQEAYINVQNEALHRIAIIQSHELRRPVASLLGIMDLIRLENINFCYLDLLETTVNELDGKIRGIVKESENTLQSRPRSVVA